MSPRKIRKQISFTKGQNWLSNIYCTSRRYRRWWVNYRMLNEIDVYSLSGKHSFYNGNFTKHEASEYDKHWYQNNNGTRDKCLTIVLPWNDQIHSKESSSCSTNINASHQKNLNKLKMHKPIWLLVKCKISHLQVIIY